MRDATLDAFRSEGDGTAGDGSQDGNAHDGSQDGNAHDGSQDRRVAGKPPEPPPVETPRSTYEWTPGGAPCGVCGANSERRWRDGEQVVCGACKLW